MTAPAPPLLSIYDGKICRGWIISRGRSGFEAFAADERSLGLFASQSEAADAVSDAAEGGGA